MSKEAGTVEDHPRLIEFERGIVTYCIPWDEATEEERAIWAAQLARKWAAADGATRLVEALLAAGMTETEIRLLRASLKVPLGAADAIERLEEVEVSFEGEPGTDGKTEAELQAAEAVRDLKEDLCELLLMAAQIDREQSEAKGDA